MTFRRSWPAAADVATRDVRLQVWESEGGHLGTVDVGRIVESGSCAPGGPKETSGSWSGPTDRYEKRVTLMKVQINSAKNVVLDPSFATYIEQELSTTLDRFSDHLTRIEVHLGDEMAGRSDGHDKRCLLEARPAGQPPVVVTDWAGTIEEAFGGAVDKLVSLLGSTTGRAHSHKGGRSIRHLEVREGLS